MSLLIRAETPSVRGNGAVFQGFLRVLSSVCIPTLLLFSIVPGAAAETTYYRSNSLGVKIEAVGPGLNRKGYVLAVEKENSVERAVLYEDGKELQRSLKEQRPDGTVKTTVTEAGETRSIEYSDASGRLTAEERFVHGEFNEKAVYQYNAGQVGTVSVTGSNGALLYTDRYERTSDGRLRRIIRTYPDGSIKRSSFGFAGERLREEITNINGTSELVRYGKTGDVEAKETWKGEKLVSRETFAYAGGKLASSTVSMEDGKSSVRKAYSPEGFVVEEIQERNGKPERTVTREYIDGVVSSETVRTKGLVEERRYGYDGEGKLLTEKYIKNGLPEKVVTWTGEKSYQEELYRNGEVFMKVTYVDGKKTEEEFIRKGETLRTRRTEGR